MLSGSRRRSSLRDHVDVIIQVNEAGLILLLKFRKMTTERIAGSRCV